MQSQKSRQNGQGMVEYALGRVPRTRLLPNSER